MYTSDDTATINSATTPLVGSDDAQPLTFVQARNEYNRLRTQAELAAQQVSVKKLLAWTSSSAKAKYTASYEEALRLHAEATEANVVATELFEIEKAAMLSQGKGRSKDYISPDHLAAAGYASGGEYLLVTGFYNRPVLSEPKSNVYKAGGT